jgi:predicted PurR-regulated permease PerM
MVNARLTDTLKILSIIILAALILLGIVAFVQRIPMVATTVVGAIFLVYIIYPAVRRLNARLPLWASIIVVYAIVLGLIAITLAFIVPSLIANMQGLIHDAPILVDKTQKAIEDPNNPFLAKLPLPVRAYLLQAPAQLALLLQQYGGRATTGVFNVVISAASILALFVVIPVVALYLLLDVDNMRRGLLTSVPTSARARVAKVALECNIALGGFIRGQLLVAAIVGALVIAVLEILHVPYAILIGIFAGVVEIVPYLGAITGALLGMAVALLNNGWQSALLVLLGFVVINQLQGHLIYPFVVSGSIGLSPLIVILALLTGGELFGLPGLVIAIPIAALIKVLLANLLPEQEPLELEPTLRRARRMAASSVLTKMLVRAKAKREAGEPQRPV